MNNTPKTTNAYYAMAWIGFIIPAAAYIVGILRLEADIQTKGFFSICFIFAIYSAFNLAKVIRDKADGR